MKDYVGIADAFAAEAIADVDRRRHCHWVRLAAARYLRDRKRATEPGSSFVWSDWHASDACDFIEKLPHVEGKWETETIVLHPAHVFFVVNVFGFRNTEDGTRRFTSALLSIARKNAKSTLCAAILLYCLCCEDEPGAQVISAATTGSQARVIFEKIAKRMVEATPDLREHFGVETFANSIVRWPTGSNFKPINAKASTQDGLNPSHTVLDEVHAHKTHDLLNVLQSAAGARLNVLWLYATTEGYETPGPWPELRQFARQLLSGLIEADHFFVLIFSLDDQEGKEGDPGFRPADDEYDEAKWPKANPLIDVNPILLREIRKAAEDAKALPSRHAEFLIKRANRQASSPLAWLRVHAWKLCGGPVDLAKLEGADCWGAIDGSATTDLFCFRLVWRFDGLVWTWGRRWVPEAAVKRRYERGLVPYRAWVDAGLMQVVPGEVMDYAIVERGIVETIERFHPKRVAYDPWGIRDMINRLKDKYPARETGDGKKEELLEEFRQGAKSYNPAMKEAERLYLSGKLRHGSDPVLNWCASNVVPRYDENLNMAPDRKRSAEKIDDAAALFMALGAMTAMGEPTKEFQLLFA